MAARGFFWLVPVAEAYQSCREANRPEARCSESSDSGEAGAGSWRAEPSRAGRSAGAKLSGVQRELRLLAVSGVERERAALVAGS